MDRRSAALDFLRRKFDLSRFRPGFDRAHRKVAHKTRPPDMAVCHCEACGRTVIAPRYNRKKFWCPECGLPLRPCGFSRSSVARNCWCGAPIRPDRKYCGRCGASLQALFIQTSGAVREIKFDSHFFGDSAFDMNSFGGMSGFADRIMRELSEGKRDWVCSTSPLGGEWRRLIRESRTRGESLPIAKPVEPRTRALRFSVSTFSERFENAHQWAGQRVRGKNRFLWGLGALVLFFMLRGCFF